MAYPGTSRRGGFDRTYKGLKRLSGPQVAAPALPCFDRTYKGLKPVRLDLARRLPKEF